MIRVPKSPALGAETKIRTLETTTIQGRRQGLSSSGRSGKKEQLWAFSGAGSFAGSSVLFSLRGGERECLFFSGRFRLARDIGGSRVYQVANDDAHVALDHVWHLCESWR